VNGGDCKGDVGLFGEVVGSRMVWLDFEAVVFSIPECHQKLLDIRFFFGQIFTYDHRSVKTGHPVRSAIHKH
jgi:hypothetical protein